MKRVILGLDPGSSCTGYGCIEVDGNCWKLLGQGQVLIPSGYPQSQKLAFLFKALQEIIQRYTPSEASLEKAFFYKNPHSALILGQMRGVVLLACEVAKLRIFEYHATEVKKTLTGQGRADKKQVQKMLQFIFGGQIVFETLDASDALALACSHVQRRIDVFGA